MIKESSPDEGKIARLRQACPDKTAVHIGLNRMARGGFARRRRLVHGLGQCRRRARGEPVPLRHGRRPGRVDDWFARQSGLLNFLMEHGLPRTVAAGLRLRGIPSGRLRAPLAPLAPEHEHTLLNILKQMEIVQ